MSPDSDLEVALPAAAFALPAGWYAVIAIAMGIAVALSAIALLMTTRNLARYRPPTAVSRAGSIAVCVPARDEVENLRPCLESVLTAATGPDGAAMLDLEVLVYDDESSDGTGELLAALCGEDERIKAVGRVPLPAGWNGKQHACDRMGRAATHEWLLFTDADVRFAPTSLAPAVATAESRGVELLSTFPRQDLASFGERLFVPMIGFILFSYLPMGRMQRTLDPAASAGCGQYLLVRRRTWLDCGGHAAFRDSMHDGIRLPRLLRRHGHRTDLFDGTALVSCRMYEGFGSCWHGFAKNAFEGLGSMALLIFVTAVHLVGHVLPWLWLVAAAVLPDLREPWSLALAATAVLLQVLQRMVLSTRLDQPRWIALLHPVAIALSVAVQWRSWWLDRSGRRSWRGRTAGAPSAAS